MDGHVYGLDNGGRSMQRVIRHVELGTVETTEGEGKKPQRAFSTG